MEQFFTEVVAPVLQPILQSKYAPWLFLAIIVVVIVIAASKVGLNVHKLIANELADTFEEHGVTEAELSDDAWTNALTDKMINHAVKALDDPVVKLRFKPLYRKLLTSKKVYNTIKNFIKKEALKFYKLVQANKGQ